MAPSPDRPPTPPIDRSLPDSASSEPTGLDPASSNPSPDRSPPRALALTPLVLLGTALTLTGMVTHVFLLGMVGAAVTGILGMRLLWPELRTIAQELLIDQWGAPFIALLGLGVAVAAVIQFTGWGDETIALLRQIDWDIVSALGSVLGAAGQILIAVLAVYIAWRQYVISKELTIQQNLLTAQQNLITQQQTIDSYFQGVSDLVLDDEGLLEDWPQERAIAEARTAAILSSIDAAGRAKVIRFLSSAKLLTPLKRDQHLGRAILDGRGGYAEDRLQGLRVIDLGVMLAKSDLAGTDLRWTDLSEINLVGATLEGCDLVRANLSRTILYETNLRGADLLGARFFYGDLETASPRSRTETPNYETGAYTGAVVENADFSGVVRLSEEQRCYCCAWGGEKTRATIPGGCRDIENRLGR
ncbi:MAG: pentapeptide repeat-containing protein [Prochlorothrix sp.]